MTTQQRRIRPHPQRPLDQRELRTLMGAAAYHSRRVARTIGLGDAEREDVEQDILLALLERRRFFDPARGAWSSFADRVSRQVAQGLADEIVSYRRTHSDLDAPTDDDEDDLNVEAALEAHRGTSSDPLEDLQLPMAIARFVAELPPELALVANIALKEDGDLAEAQRHSKLSSSEFYRRLREIRYRLVCAGIVRKRFGSDGTSATASHDDAVPDDLLGKTTASIAT
jgi:DNA-directed RNA polymerase specialized sigma24 family protein